jgi:hypothetical protein
MDDVMARVTAAVQRGRDGERADARRELEALWAEVEAGGGDDFHRCVIAHFAADLQDDGRDELAWDERALAAVEGVSDEPAQEFDRSLRVRAFLPSLYCSLADDHRRPGPRPGVPRAGPGDGRRVGCRRVRRAVVRAWRRRAGGLRTFRGGTGLLQAVVCSSSAFRARAHG